jgi:hypothetical protein
MFTRIHGVLLLLLLLPSNHSNAVMLPKVEELERLLAESPAGIEVVEPHLVEGNSRPHVVYLGYPAEKVFRGIFGDQWKTAAYIEFRALDGYVSRIPTERFGRHRAYLVFAKKDAREFRVDNLAQHERDVPLAPYYLVWDNILQPELIREGGTYWPYQVNEILMSSPSPEPGIAAGAKSRDALDLEKYCLNCHHVNGSGGNKAPFDLAERARILGEENFLAWVLNPASIRPETRMPAINEGMPESERRALAFRLFVYLNQLPHDQVDRPENRYH